MNSKHLKFEEDKHYTNHKTKIYQIISQFDNTYLGEIKWNPKWRQYCFYPQEECVWSHDCLTDVSEFIKEKMKERKITKNKQDTQVK